MTWRSATVFFFLTSGLIAFPSATQLTWITTAEARPIPQRLPISPERLNLAVPDEPAASEEKNERRFGP